MSPRTRAGIRGCAHMVALLWQVNPEVAVRYASDLRNALDRRAPNFHPRRQAADAARDAVDSLLSARHKAGAR